METRETSDGNVCEFQHLPCEWKWMEPMKHQQHTKWEESTLLLTGNCSWKEERATKTRVSQRNSYIQNNKKGWADRANKIASGSTLSFSTLNPCIIVVDFLALPCPDKHFACLLTHSVKQTHTKLNKKETRNSVWEVVKRRQTDDEKQNKPRNFSLSGFPKEKDKRHQNNNCQLWR